MAALKKWFEQFVVDYGNMVFWMTVTSTFGVGFIIAGITVEPLGDKLIGAGVTLLIGAASIASNKSRTTKPVKQNDKDEQPVVK